MTTRIELEALLAQVKAHIQTWEKGLEAEHRIEARRFRERVIPGLSFLQPDGEAGTGIRVYESNLAIARSVRDQLAAQIEAYDAGRLEAAAQRL